jgi:hypothetical protein
MTGRHRKALAKLNSVMEYLASAAEWDAYAELVPVWCDLTRECYWDTPALRPVLVEWLGGPS